MTNNPNTSQFVKTYGKPRLTQKLTQDSLWHDNFADDFDKVLGIEDVHQTTFISPESASFRTVYKPDNKKFKKKINKMNTIDGYSMNFQSSLTGSKTSTAFKKRSIQHFGYNYKPRSLLASAKKKTNEYSGITNNHNPSTFNINCSEIDDNIIVPLPPIKNTKNKLILSKNKCSTPLQKSVLFVRKNKFSTNSSKKKKMLKKSKRHLGFPNANFSDLCKSSEKKMKYGSFEQSLFISGSHCPKSNFNNKSDLNDKYNQNEIFNSHESSNGSNKSYSNKNKLIVDHSAKEKIHSGWYKNVKKILYDENTNSFDVSFNKSYDKKNITSFEKTQKSDNCESVVICNDVSMSLEHQKQISETSLSSSKSNTSFHSIKNIEKKSFKKDNVSFVSPTKSNKNDIDFENIKDTVFEKVLLTSENLSELCDDSLYKSCFNIDENRQTDHSKSLNLFHVSDIDSNASSELFVDKPKSVDCKLSKTNQNKTTMSCIKSICRLKDEIKLLPLNNSKGSDLNASMELLADCLNIERLSVPQHYDNDKSNTSINQSSCLFIENLSVLSDNSHCDFKVTYSECDSLLDITEKLSNIKVESKSQLTNESIKQSVSSRSLNLLDDNSTLKQDNVSNSSLSILQCSLISEQCTIIYKNKLTDTSSKENADPNNVLSSGINNEPYSSNYSRKNISNRNLVCDKINSSKDVLCNSDSHYNTRQSNTQNESFASNNRVDQVNHQPNYSRNLYDPVENATIDFDNISCINYEGDSIIDNKLNTSNIMLNNTMESNISNIDMSRRKRYAGRFLGNLNLDTIKESYDQEVIHQNQTPLNCTQSWEKKPGFRLEPGKKWRRSILIVRNYIGGITDDTSNVTQDATKGRKWCSTVDVVLRKQSIDSSIHSKINQSNTFRNSMSRYSERHITGTHYTTLQGNLSGIEKENVRNNIFKMCNQQNPILFEEWLNTKKQKNMKKVGEGVYGEVFSYCIGKYNTIVKIIPIEGKEYINGERQKNLSEIYNELFISNELNKLFDKNGWNYTNSFCKLKNLVCIQGKYPNNLISLWKQYNKDKGSDNDNPNILPDKQMFMVLEMEDCGIDVESYIFCSAYQALFGFIQIVFGLAIAEQQFNFEHRDLHIGNVLVKKTTSSNKYISYKLDGEMFNVPSHGIKIKIIDFTLSRITHLGKPIFNNLADDPELFTSDGDYQFEIYRLMKKETNDEWDSYAPKTNIYWLHYVLDKMLDSVHYKKINTSIHNIGIKHLKNLKNCILSFNSAKSFSQSDLILDLIK